MRKWLLGDAPCCPPQDCSVLEPADTCPILPRSTPHPQLCCDKRERHLYTARAPSTHEQWSWLSGAPSSTAADAACQRYALVPFWAPPLPVPLLLLLLPALLLLLLVLLQLAAGCWM